MVLGAESTRSYKTCHYVQLVIVERFICKFYDNENALETPFKHLLMMIQTKFNFI